MRIDGYVNVTDSRLGDGRAASAVVHTPDGGVLTVALCTWGDGSRQVRVLDVRNRSDVYGVLADGLRIGVYPSSAGQLFMELTELTVNSEGRLLAVKTDSDALSRLSTSAFRELLANTGVIQVGTKEEVLGAGGPRRDYLVATFDESSFDAPVACFVYCRVLPLTLGHVSRTNSEIGPSISEPRTIPDPRATISSSDHHSVSRSSLRPILNRSLFDVPPTDEQEAVLAHAGTSKDIVVEALAGTGKTSTLRMFAQASQGRKGQYLAFNRAIVNEASSTFPANVSCRTAHQLAYAGIGHRYRNRINGPRVRNADIAERLQCQGFAFKSGSTNLYLTPEQIARYTWETVRAYCRTPGEELNSRLVPLPVNMQEDSESAAALSETVLEYARDLWLELTDPDGTLSWNGSHDIYLKLWQLSNPRIPVDFIMFDEAQDADPVMLSVINDQDHAQLLYCGDDYQTLYEWRGAQNALAMAPTDERLWLTQSFRFGPAIADTANFFLDRLKAPYAIRGNPQLRSSVGRVESPSAVICRTNSAVFAALIEAHNSGRRAAVLGGARDLDSLATACSALQRGQRTSHPDLAPFKNWREVMTWIEENPEQDPTLARDLKLIDKFTPSGIKRVLTQIVDEKESDVVISTAHQAKGREWSTVRLGIDFLHPDDMATEELRVGYVAATRGKDRLDTGGLFSDERRDPKKQTRSTQPTAGAAGKKRPRIPFNQRRRRFG